MPIDRRRRQQNTALDIASVAAMVAAVILAMSFAEQFFAWLFA